MADDKLTNLDLENRLLGMMLHGARVTSLCGEEFTSEERQCIYLLLRQGKKSSINHQHYWIGDLRKMPPIEPADMPKAVAELKRLLAARLLDAQLEKVRRRLHRLTLEEIQAVLLSLPGAPASELPS